VKIVLLDINYGQGSTGKIVYELFKSLRSSDNQVFVFFGRGKNLKDENEFIKKFSTNLEVLLHALCTRIFGLTDGFSPFATNRLIRKIKKINPDIVHLHDIHGYILNIKKLTKFLKDNNIATVWTMHCEFMYTGRCGYAMECQNWQSGCRVCPDLKRYPRSWFFDFASKMFQDKIKIFENFNNLHLVCPSIWLSKRMNHSFLKDIPNSVIYNGIDTEMFRPKKRTIGYEPIYKRIENRLCVLSIGANLMSERKGGQWVIKLAERFKEMDVVFLMVGVEENLRNLTNNIITLPHVHDQDKLSRIYALGDIFLLTSQKETFSMVCAEALSCGLPIVGFESGAPVEVAPKGYGDFVEYGNLDELEKIMKKKLKKRTGSITKKNFNFAQEKYSIKSMTESYSKVYRNLLSNK